MDHQVYTVLDCMETHGNLQLNSTELQVLEGHFPSKYMSIKYYKCINMCEIN